MGGAGSAGVFGAGQGDPVKLGRGEGGLISTFVFFLAAVAGV